MLNLPLDPSFPASVASSQAAARGQAISGYRVHVPASPHASIDVGSRFEARLRELRRERNLTQTRMATVFGIDRSYISDVERGRKSISLPMLEVIALGLGITLSELLKDI